MAMNTQESVDQEKNDLAMKRELLKNLKTNEDHLNQKLSILQQAATDKAKVMDTLHEYNDIKDATQVVLGQLASFYNVTVLEMHEKYNLVDSS